MLSFGRYNVKQTKKQYIYIYSTYRFICTYIYRYHRISEWFSYRKITIYMYICWHISFFPACVKSLPNIYLLRIDPSSMYVWYTMCLFMKSYVYVCVFVYVLFLVRYKMGNQAKEIFVHTQLLIGILETGAVFRPYLKAG